MQGLAALRSLWSEQPEGEEGPRRSLLGEQMPRGAAEVATCRVVRGTYGLGGEVVETPGREERYGAPARGITTGHSR